jgi:hypothetical protein
MCYSEDFQGGCRENTMIEQRPLTTASSLSTTKVCYCTDTRTRSAHIQVSVLTVLALNGKSIVFPCHIRVKTVLNESGDYYPEACACG